jgi:hypothetical protein
MCGGCFVPSCIFWSAGRQEKYLYIFCPVATRSENTTLQEKATIKNLIQGFTAFDKQPQVIKVPFLYFFPI